MSNVAHVSYISITACSFYVCFKTAASCMLCAALSCVALHSSSVFLHVDSAASVSAFEQGLTMKPGYAKKKAKVTRAVLCVMLPALSRLAIH
jgi:hypothetical protein